MLRAFFLWLVFFVAAFFVPLTKAVEINPTYYDIYYGDLNNDGASDFYFVQKPLILIIHGDISTPIPLQRFDHFAIYRNGINDYTSPQLFSLTDTQLAQRVAAGTLRLAILSTDYFVWEQSGRSYVLLRGVDSSTPALLLASYPNQVLPDKTYVYPVGSYPYISTRSTPLKIFDANGDDIFDIVVGDDSNEYITQTAYLADASGKPITPFEMVANISVPSMPIDDSGIRYHVGTVGGQFRVDESGAATYTIPINLPEGVAGVTPQLSLGYSSQAGIGLLGKGWFLAAYSSISRCRQTLSQDGSPKPISWSSEDRFCLDGQRLILTSGTYGSSGSVYKTEIDNYSRISIVGGTAGHPGYFKIEGKDGSVSYYGRTNNSKVFHSAGGVSTTTLSWVLSRFEDNIGNGIDYQYEGDSTSGHRLKNIYYAYILTSKNPSSIPQSTSEYKAKITFNYVDAYSTNSAYVSGYEFKQAKKLNQILVYNRKVDSSVDEEVRRYTLSYMPITAVGNRYRDNIDRLEKVVECRGTSDCLAPLTFSWGGGSYLVFNKPIQSIDFPDATDGKYLLNHTFADVTGNGKQDFIYLMYEKNLGGNKANLALRIKYADTTAQSVISMSSVADYRNIAIANLDYNADGRQDIAVYNGAKWLIYLSTPRPSGDWRIDAGSGSTIIDTGLTDKEVSFIDVNSDGLPDAVSGAGYRLLVRNQQPITSNQAYSFQTTQTALAWGSNSNYPGLSDPIAGPYSCGPESIKRALVPTKPADFNGDGVVDFVGAITRTATCIVPSPSGSEIISNTKYYLVTLNNSVVSNYGGDNLPTSEIYTVDLNGDGLTDVVYLSSSGKYSYKINNGTGFGSPVEWLTLPTFSSGTRPTPQFIDVNNDSAMDAVWHNRNTSQIYVRLWGTSSDVILRAASGSENDAHLMMDVSGDGVLDYLKITTSAITGQSGSWAHSGEPYCGQVPVPNTNPTQYHCQMVTPALVVPDSRQNDAIYAIENGLGAITQINYGTLSNSGHYQTTDVNLNVTTHTYPTGCYGSNSYCPPTYTTTVADPSNFYGRLNGGWELPEGSNTLVSGNTYKDKPVLEVNGSMQVVISVESSAPAAGASPEMVNQGAKSKVEYHYAEAKMQASGRGFLGFGKLKTIDTQTGITTVTSYRQDFPFTGSPLSTVVYKNNTGTSPVLSRAINTWNFSEFTSQDSVTKYYQIQLAASYEQSLDYGNSELLQTVTTENAYDSYGNLVSSNVVTTGKKVDGATTSLTKVTSNAYGSTNDEKRLGRLSSSMVTTTRDSESSQTRKSIFTYYGTGDDKGAQYLLKTEKVDDPNLATTTITYEYDQFGNKAKVITAASANDKRSVSYDYGTKGRYLISTINDLNQVATINQRNEFGNIKSANDINSIESKVYYDAMGSEYMRKDSTGVWSRTDTQYCSSSVACPTSASYRVFKRVAGGGKAYEYYDMLGRVIRSTNISFDGTPVHVDTEYDNLGRTKRQSAPFTGSTAEYWTENEYDHLGRIVKVTAPDNSVSTSTYSGNTTVIKNALNQTRTEYRNGLGQLVRVKDQLNGLIDYEYDLNGGLVRAKTTADAISVSVQICYDALGRKVAMYDPDKGGFKGNATLSCAQVVGANPKKAGWWYYSYNAYGELVEQTDPKAQRIKNYYDNQGRMVGRIDYLASGAIEGLTQWFYEGGVGTHNPGVQGKLTAIIMNTASGLTTAQAESFINTKTASCSETNSSCYKTLYDFDIYARPITTTVYYPGSSQAYIARTSYDLFGRVYKQYDALDGVIVDSNGKRLESGIQTQYNIYGYAYKTTDIDTGKTLQLTQKTNLLGQVTEEVRGNGLTSVNTYDIKTGLLTNQKTLNALNLTNVQNNVYGWDVIGNLSYRQNLSGKPGTPTAGNSAINTYAQSESFCYDVLNRLIKTNAGMTSTAVCSGVTSATQDIRYDGHGNIRYKKGVGDYTYASGTVAGPHAVTTAGGLSYIYDANGNNTSSIDSNNASIVDRTLEYTSYDMVKKITKGTNSSEFLYGPDRSRWQRKDSKNGTPTTTTYMGNVERIQTSANTIEWKRNVAGVVLTYKTNAANNLQATDKRYIYTDHLGSVDLITDANGETSGQHSKVSHGMSFDAWGARRNIAQWDAATFTLALSSITVSGFQESITRRGFTGHEMVDDMGIIHMNGRIYDPNLARFLQADPFIDGVKDTQGYNRYSYLQNNPLNATDPSGFFSFKREFKRHLHMKDTHKFLNERYPKAIPFIQIALAFIPKAGPYASAAFSANNAYYVSGGKESAGIKSFAISMVSMGIFKVIGDKFTQSSGIYTKNGAGHIFAHAVAGGVLAELQGGKFGHGFMSGGLTKGFMGHSGFDYSDGSWEAIAGRTIIAAVVGGTISEMTGGKFANGAVTAAMAQLFNNELTAAQKRAYANQLREKLLADVRMEKEAINGWSNKEFATFFGFSKEVGLSIVNRQLDLIERALMSDAALAATYEFINTVASEVIKAPLTSGASLGGQLIWNKLGGAAVDYFMGTNESNYNYDLSGWNIMCHQLDSCGITSPNKTYHPINKIAPPLLRGF